METLLDEGRGQAVGSRVRMKGKMMGVKLLLDEVITERTPPHRKVWETIGKQRLLVIDNYRLGFDIGNRNKSSQLRVFIDYNLPGAPLSWVLGLMLGPLYAKWCVRQIVTDARKHFLPSS